MIGLLGAPLGDLSDFFLLCWLDILLVGLLLDLLHD